MDRTFYFTRTVRQKVSHRSAGVELKDAIYSIQQRPYMQIVNVFQSCWNDKDEFVIVYTAPESAYLADLEAVERRNTPMSTKEYRWWKLKKLFWATHK